MRKIIQAKDYADEFADSSYFAQYVNHTHWDDSFKTEVALRIMISHATKNGYEVIDLEEFDSETFFWKACRSIESGLS
jgi:hypothetical protein